MRTFFIIMIVLSIIIGIGYIMIGDGAFKNKFTVSGIVTVRVGDNTTCFVDSEAHGISCLPNWFIKGSLPVK